MKSSIKAFLAALFLLHALAPANQLNPTPDPCCACLTMENADEINPTERGPGCPYPTLVFDDDDTASVRVKIIHNSSTTCDKPLTVTVGARSKVNEAAHPTVHNITISPGATSVPLEFIFTEIQFREHDEWEIFFSCDQGASGSTSTGECSDRIPVRKKGCETGCPTGDCADTDAPSVNEDGSLNMPLAPDNGGSSAGGGDMHYRPIGTDTDAELANPGPIALTPSIPKRYGRTRGSNGAITSISSRSGTVQVIPATALLAQDPNAFTIVHKNASNQEYRTTTCSLINDGGIKRLRMDSYFNGATFRYEQTKTSPNTRILEQGRMSGDDFAPLRQTAYVRTEPSPGARVYRVTVKERPTSSAAWSVVSVTETTWQKQVYDWVMTKQVIDPDGAALTSTWTYYQPGEATGTTSSEPEAQYNSPSGGTSGAALKSSFAGVARLKQAARFDGYQAFYTYNHNSQTVTMPYAGNPSGKVTTITWDPGSRTRTMTTKINGIISAQESEKFTDTTSITTTARSIGGDSGGGGGSKVRSSNYGAVVIGTDFGGKVGLVKHEDDTITTYAYTRHTGGGYTTITETGSTASENGTTVAKGTRTTTTKNSRGTTILRKTEAIGYGTGSAIFDCMAVTAADPVGRPLTIFYHAEIASASANGEIAVASNPAWTTTTEYSCCGISSQTDKYGVKTLYSYDGLKRRIKSNSLGVTTEMHYNGLTVETHRYAEAAETSVSAIPLAASSTIISRSVRNLSGTLQESWSSNPTSTGNGALVRSSSSTTAYLNPQSSNLPPNLGSGIGSRSVTTTADNFTQTTDSFLDGRTAKTYGDLSPAMQYAYTVNTTGEVTSQSYVDDTQLRETTSTQTDWDGRTLRMDYMDGSFATMEYNAKGQMIKSTDPDGVVTLMTYNTEGEQTITAIDLNRNGIVDFGSDTVQFSETVPALDTVSNPVWKSISKVWQPGDTSPTGGTIVSTSTQTPNGLSSSSESIGAANPSTSLTVLNGNGNWTSISIAPDGTKSVSTYTAGKMVSMAMLATNNTVIESQTQAYDALNRPITSTHSRTGASTTNYLSDTADIVASVSDSGGRTTAFTYDVRGRQISVNAPDTVDANNQPLTNITTTTYNPDNTVAETNGDQTYRVSHTYDYAQRQISMTTYGTETATTTWQYSPTRGFLLAKRDAVDKGATYTRTASGRLTTRTWARGVTTTYAYDNGGRMVSTNYSDSTPDVTMAYDAMGRQTTQTNGLATSTFAYNVGNLQMDTETVNYTFHGKPAFTRVLDRSQDTLARESGWQLKEGTTIENDVQYHYSATDGRLAKVRRGDIPVPQEFNYTYTPNSSLIASITGPAHTVSNVYETTRNVLASKVNKKLDTTTVSSYFYNVNNYGQRTGVNKDGTAFASTRTIAWGYNSKGEVVKADSSEAGLDRAYAFDGIGNRISGGDQGSPISYTPNVLNQYNAIGSLTPVHDDDGNMTSGPLPANVNANSTLLWDGENRLIQAQVNSGATVNFVYDSQSRRIAETVGSATTVYVYDGWNPIAEYNTTFALIKTYTWGLDLSGSMQGAGGVGGLLSVTDSTGTYFPTFDGNGNVSEYLDSTGNIVAHYEYDPFGKTTVATGSKANDFAHRFSTKPLDLTTGLYYYGYRFYDPETGRWPSRDPIEEDGGINLYGYIENNPIGSFDYLGLHSEPRCRTKCRAELPKGMSREECFQKCKTDPDHNYNDKTSIKICQRDILNEDGSCVIAAANCLGGEHTFIEWTDSKGNQGGWGFAGRTAPEKAFKGTCKTLYLKKDTIGKVTDDKIIECIKNHKPSKPYKSWGWNKYNCKDWAKEAYNACGLRDWV
jgi:RHS repeat-associated protein